ncbi:MAG TPA: PDDEXK nuclease domain-containing protein [Candidatus Binatia bacterium]
MGEILESARRSVARTVNTTQVVANWLVGREIVEEEQAGKRRAAYGAELLSDLAAKLTREFGTGYSVDNLELFRRFYLEYTRLLPDEKSETVRRISASSQKSDAVRRKSERRAAFIGAEKPHALRGELTNAVSALQIGYGVRDEFEDEAGSVSRMIRHAPRDESWQPGRLHPNLSWTHYRTLLRVGRVDARAFYEIEAIRNTWSARELERQINSLLFERLAKSRDKKGLMRLATRGQEVMQPIDVFKDPTVIEFLGLPESPRLVESKLEQALINNLQTFLLELGKGFAFVSRQERITLDGDHFYIDLVFYHTILKCYVLIDLKVGKLTHADLGQIQFYVNYFDRERRTEGDNLTLGLILCPDKNDAVVKYTLGEQLARKIFTSRYQLYLPTEEELEQELRRELRQLALPGPQVRRKRTRKP